ncbi:hypothetical protein NDU88_004988 [Pleurodeles waltl]|uniref:Uncharacterized protein n=1 Tax=Pleurodeles waltl TaxID=8319 RepID=A0AAV7UGT2_PLEWA|nr:hypothetical protein NDU88_004988 [Pleurodeles waltl]
MRAASATSYAVEKPVTGRHWRRTRHTPGAPEVQSFLTQKSLRQEPILRNFRVKMGRKGALPSDPGKQEEEPETKGMPKETTETEETRADQRTAPKQEDIGATSGHLKEGRTRRQYSKIPAMLWEERGLHRGSECDWQTLASDSPYTWGTGRVELPDPEVLGTGTNPEELLGEDGQKRDSAVRPREAGEGARDKGNAGGEDEDGPEDGARAGRHRGHQSPSEGREDQEAILQNPGHALGRTWPPQVCGQG